MSKDLQKWEETIHQTAFTYLKYKEYLSALEFLKNSDLYLESSSDGWYDGDRLLTGWHLYIYLPIELMDKFNNDKEYLKEDISEAYSMALEPDSYLREVHVGIKKITESEFHFNFQEKIATISKKFDYDVVLSFAGEDRKYVEELANFLLYKNIRVFYDRFNTVDSWGKDLYLHFDAIYRKKARYCVMFLSKNFAEKLWTNHERQMAQARAFEEKKEYILPVRFDDTEIPGFVPTISYINANEVEPKKLAEMIVEKIKHTN